MEDAAGDDRFARDPYFAAVGACSLLAVPIVTRGTLGAVLLLENRLLRGAFTAERLESVKLIAGQLAVSLDNAHVNAEYRRIAEDQAALRRVAVLAARAVASVDLFGSVAAEVITVLGADLGTLLARYGPDRDVECMGAWQPRGPAPFVGRRMSLGGDDVSTLVFEWRAGPRRPDTRHQRACGRHLARVRGPRGGRCPDHGRRTALGRRGRRRDRRGRGCRRAPSTAWPRSPSSSPRPSPTRKGRAELEASRARLVTEADAARRRVVRDLHDGAQNSGSFTRHLAELAQRALRLNYYAEPLITEALGHVQQANEELRELAHGILPAALARGGLRGGVDAVVERLDLAVTVELPDERLPAEIEASAYFRTRRRRSRTSSSTRTPSRPR